MKQQKTPSSGPFKDETEEERREEKRREEKRGEEKRREGKRREEKKSEEKRKKGSLPKNQLSLTKYCIAVLAEMSGAHIFMDPYGKRKAYAKHIQTTLQTEAVHRKFKISF